MKWSDLPLNPSPRMLRQFAAAWLVVFLALAWRQGLMRGHPLAGGVLGAVALLGVIGLVKPASLRWVFIGATVAAFPIGWVMTQAMLLVMFFLVLTPVALVFRLVGRDALRLRRREAASFWTDHGDPPPAERYLKQF